MSVGGSVTDSTLADALSRPRLHAAGGTAVACAGMSSTLRIASLAVLLVAGHAVAQPAPICGNGVVEPPETCDDGNLVDGDGCSALCQVENLPPDCSAAFPTLDELWPPNHKFAPIGVLGVTDPDGDPVTIVVTGVMQDEPLVGAGDGNTCPDATGVGTDTASVRAERSGQGDGRVYHVSFTADDGRGGTCAGTVAVCVRHDHRPNGVCGDGGALVDSTSGQPPAPCQGECGPEDCAPPPEAITPPECAADEPASIDHRIGKARALLARAAQRSGHARRLGRKAARQLHRAADAARTLSPECAGVLGGRLDAAATCAMCVGQ
jgi:cysteine-rich repeat protein